MITEQDVAPHVVTVRKVARMMARNLNGKVSPDDLQQVAWIRIMVEWDRYIPDKSSRRAWICRLAFQAMVDAVRTGECNPEIVTVPRLSYKRGARVKTEAVKPRHVPYKESGVQPTYSDFVRTAEQSLGRVMKSIERELAWLYFGHGLTMKEAGALNGLSEARVSQVIGEMLNDAYRQQSVQYAKVGVILPERAKGRADKNRKHNYPSGRATTLEASKPHEN